MLLPDAQHLLSKHSDVFVTVDHKCGHTHSYGFTLNEVHQGIAERLHNLSQRACPYCNLKDIETRFLASGEAC